MISRIEDVMTGEDIVGHVYTCTTRATQELVLATPLYYSFFLCHG